MSKPCSLFLWRRGRWSGPVLDALGRRTGHIRSYASWELQCYLEAGAAVGVLVTACRRRERPMLSWCRGRAIVGGSADMNPEVAETLK